MTDATISATDLLNGGAAPPRSAPAPVVPPAPDPITAAFNQPEAVQARAQIDTLKGDKEFYAKLQQKDPAAHRLWSDLHKSGFPAPAEIRSQADVESQASARNAEFWNNHIAALRAQFPLTPNQEAEIRSGIVDAAAHRWATEEKQRLISDRAWRTRYFDGDRQARLDWGLVLQILSLRPVPGYVPPHLRK